MMYRVTECYRALESVREFYRVLQSVKECYKVFKSITEHYRILRSVTECYRVLDQFLGLFLQNVQNEFYYVIWQCLINDGRRKIRTQRRGTVKITLCTLQGKVPVLRAL